MSRVHFIPKPTSATTTETTPMQQALAPIAAAITPIQPTEPVTAAFTEILGESIPTVRSAILQSFVSSLNLQLVTRAREAIRERNKPRDQRQAEDDNTPSIDQRNEADDQLGDNGSCYGGEHVDDPQFAGGYRRGELSYDEANANYAGNRLAMPAAEIVKRLGIIRAFCLQEQEALRSNNVVPFVPRPLQESVDWLLSQLPVNVKPSDPAILVAMELTGMSAEECVAVRSAGHASERAELEAMAPEMIAMGNDATTHYKPDAQACEEAFDSLPAHIKVNLFISALNGCVSCYASAFKKVVMRGNVIAAGDMPIAKSLYKRGLVTLNQMSAKHVGELTEFMERGGSIKELKPLS